MTQGKRRVAILGGGVAGLTTAYELTNPDQGGECEVTLYQLGWRLGGKCASGRDQTLGCRVQEHGLHVFFGFYDNAFQVLRDCYRELDPPKGDRFRSIWDAVEPYDEITLIEEIDGRQVPWVIDCPKQPGHPGDKSPPSIWSTVIHAFGWLINMHGSLVDELATNRKEHEGFFVHLERMLSPGTLIARLTGLKDELATALDIAKALGEAAASHDHQDHSDLAAHIKSTGRNLGTHLGPVDKLGVRARRLLILFDFAMTNLAGALEDGLVRDPWANLPHVNRMDYRDWLNRHSMLHLAEKSVVVQALYDLIFAYPGGDIRRKGDVAAGAMLLALAQLWRYRGSVIWKMRAGTGDVVAAPLYKVLKKRGVRFEFFSRVDELLPSDDGRRIDAIRVGRQVTLKSGTYEPLFRCHDVDCWPAAPLYDQIVQGDELKRLGIDLESPWTTWPDAGGELRLERGRDFDEVVLAVSVAALPGICGRLIAANPRWRRMVDETATVETMNAQLWFDRSLAETGWRGKPGTVLGGYDVSQLDTWADISEVLGAECWSGSAPRNASILVGPMKGPDRPPPPTERGYPAQAQKIVEAEARTFLEGHSAALWPRLNKDGFDWSALHASEGLKGPERLLQQYLRANIAPTERYVMSRAGTIGARIRADDSGYENLVLAGDWIDNPQNLGSFEATVMSGKLASRALTDLPTQILRVSPDDPLMRPPPDRPPLFVDHVGSQTFPGRISFENVTLWAYLLPADLDRLAAICRTFFDEPSGGAVSCLPLSSHVMISFADMGRGRFDARPDMGWSGEKELAFWIFVGRRRAPGSNEIVSAHMFNPYLFLDNPVAMLTGREVFGFQKQAGWVDLPAHDPGTYVLRADAFGVITEGPYAEWKRVPLLALERSVEREEARDGLESLESAMHRLHAESTGGGLVWPGLKLLEQVARDIAGGRLPNIFLKQFRDIRDGRLACYQAICTADAQVTRFHGAHLLRPGTLTLHPVANLPIARDLGIAAQGTTGYGVRLSIDMTLHPGREIWRAKG